jgi:hypothetical protein
MPITVSNPLLAPLLDHRLDHRRQWIASQLSQLNIPSVEQPFTTPIASGCNLYIPPRTTARPSLLLLAHYDGDTPQDNAGGVWLTLQILQQFWANPPAEIAIAALFTDQEEIFQQGASSFIKHHLRTPTPLLNSPKILCIDGYGAGTSITSRHHTELFTVLGHYFRMDADSFREAGFDVWTLHSGVECVQPARPGHNCIDDVGNLSFADHRLYDLKGEAIDQFLKLYDAMC